MTQYCRYCSLAVLNDDDLIYCEAKDEMREGKQIRNPKKKNIEGQVSFL